MPSIGTENVIQEHASDWLRIKACNNYPDYDLCCTLQA